MNSRQDETFVDTARAILIAWEKLRIAYVFILASETILFIIFFGFLNHYLFVLILKGAVVANIAFFAGPITEIYIQWLGYHRAWPRWVMFTGGTLLSTILVVGVVLSEFLPNQS